MSWLILMLTRSRIRADSIPAEVLHGLLFLLLPVQCSDVSAIREPGGPRNILQFAGYR
ncbi:hypothetical protein N826_04710 [Skermanella aerolata KACC 11604]|nr:hypothetical protein N826_04710 [Skermanella aerolata KACC 11604]